VRKKGEKHESTFRPAGTNLPTSSQSVHHSRKIVRKGSWPGEIGKEESTDTGAQAGTRGKQKGVRCIYAFSVVFKKKIGWGKLTQTTDEVREKIGLG